MSKHIIADNTAEHSLLYQTTDYDGTKHGSKSCLACPLL